MDDIRLLCAAIAFGIMMSCWAIIHLVEEIRAWLNGMREEKGNDR